MIQQIKSFLKEEEGMGTVEIVVIIAVLVGIALIFRATIFTFVREAVDTIFGQGRSAIHNVDGN